MSKVCGFHYVTYCTCDITGDKCYSPEKDCKIRKVAEERDEAKKKLEKVRKYLQDSIKNIEYNCKSGLTECECWESDCPNSDSVSCDVIDTYREMKKLLEGIK